MINGLAVGNRDREESRIVFQISELNNRPDGVIFSQKKEIGWKNTLDVG